MANVQITATLGSPVMGGDFTLPIDGILLAASMRDVAGFPAAFFPRQAAPQIDYDSVPLDIVQNGEEWFYAASFAVWDTYTEGTAYWNKRLDALESERYSTASKANIGSGKHKAYHYQVFYRHALKVRWFVRGDIDRIAYLLDMHVSHIGKKAAQGFGHVLKWDIETVKFDHSLDNGERYMRAIPMSYIQRLPQIYITSDIARRAFRPPYWLPEHQGMVAYD